MNYYEHHLGDYAKDTAHLTMLEDGAYRRLLDRYYGTEQGIPADQAHRICRARSREEKAAVDAVLEEFFFLAEGVWKNNRAEEEIKKFSEKKPKADEKRENDKERQRRARERRKSLFEELSALGVHMAWNATTEELHAALEDAKSRTGHTPVTPPVTRDNTATQAPDTRHQTPKGALQAAVAQPESRARAPDAAAAIHHRAIELTALLRARGAALQASDPKVIGWAERGVSDAAALSALEVAQSRRAEAADPRPVNAGYLDAILSDDGAMANGTRRRATAGEQRAATIAALTGRDRSDARTLDGTAERVD